MALKVKFVTLLNTSFEYELSSSMSIFEIKQFLKANLQGDFRLFKNSYELYDGTLESNHITNNDEIKIVINVRSGFDRVENTIQRAQIESYINEYDDLIEEFVQDNLNSAKKVNSQISPFEELGRLQYERGISTDDYEREDIRVLFQRCYEQIEDEHKKMEQTKKENETTKRKLEYIQNKMKKRKQQQIKLFNRTENKQNDKVEKLETTSEINTETTKNTFCGFKKGFLLI